LREPPEAILRELRELDPVYDLHYLGDGRWVVGRVVLNNERIATARNMKRNIARNPHLPHQEKRLRMAELAEYGFGVVAFYKFQGEPTGELVNDVRQREFNHRRDREAAFERALASSDFREPLPDDIYDQIEYRERHVAPELFRARRHFDQGRIQ
jgi:hypothetical protein